MKKGPMKEWLKESLENKVVVVGEEAATANMTKKKKAKPTIQKSMIGWGFIECAYWEILDVDKIAVDEPENPTFKVPQAPTIGECDGEFVPVKHNFSKHKFYVHVFKGTHKIPQQFVNGRVKQNKDGSFMWEEVIRKMDLSMK